MSSSTCINDPSVPAVAFIALKSMCKYHWTFSDAIQFLSIINRIKSAKKKGFIGIAEFKLRPLVRSKLEGLGYKTRFNCWYWIIYSSN